jgi:hypothetical protein
MIDQILYPTVSILEMVETWDVMIHIYIYIHNGHFMRRNGDNGDITVIQ